MHMAVVNSKAESTMVQDFPVLFFRFQKCQVDILNAWLFHLPIPGHIPAAALQAAAEPFVCQCLLNVYGLSSNCLQSYNNNDNDDQYTGELMVFVAAAVETGILFWIIGASIYFGVRLLCADSSPEFTVCPAISSWMRSYS